MFWILLGTEFSEEGFQCRVLFLHRMFLARKNPIQGLPESHTKCIRNHLLFVRVHSLKLSEYWSKLRILLRLMGRSVYKSQVSDFCAGDFSCGQYCANF